MFTTGCLGIYHGFLGICRGSLYLLFNTLPGTAGTPGAGAGAAAGGVGGAGAGAGAGGVGGPAGV